MKANGCQKLFGVLLFFACLLFFVSPADARSQLRVGVPLTAEAELEQDASGHIYSAETDYMQAIASYASYDAVLLPDTWDVCRSRLASGAIDVIIGIEPGSLGTEGMSFSRLPMGWRRGSELSLQAADAHIRPHYFAVRAGNDALLRELDAAADRLVENRPGFLTTLDQIYADHGQRFGLNLTQREKDYLALHPVIPVVVVARERPFAYVDEQGAFQGTLRFFTDRIQEDLGVTLRVITVPDFAAAEAELASGRAQVLLDNGWDLGWAKAHRLWFTAPFYVSNYTEVRRRGDEPETPVVAAVDDRTTDRILRRRYNDSQIRIYPTIFDCMKAVEAGEADITFVRQAAAQYHIYQGDFPDLVSDGSVAFSLEMAAGVSMDVPIELLTIFDKEIAYIGPETITNAAAKSDKEMESNRSLQSIMYAYPQYVMLAGLTTFLLVVIFIMNAVTTRRTHMRDMVRLLDEDQATHMKNRAWFHRQAKGCIAAHALVTDELSIVLIGVQRVDIFTSTYGRESLMDFVRQLASALDRAVWTECVATHGSVGEVIALAHMKDLGELKSAIKDVLKQHEFANVGGIVVRVPVQAGIAPIGKPATSADEAMQRADFAMHEAQDILVYDAKMLDRAHLVSRMESLQEQALAREEFEVWYQPKYHIETKKCIGAEALVRWQSEELGFLPPGKFIPLFESNGFISKLDFYNLEHVMRFQHDCVEKGLPVVPISVNQSRVHMQEQGYLRKMRDLVVQYSTDGIALELTETAFDFASSGQREHSLAVVAALHGLGFRIDMDDFGSGYSDLSLLNYLPFDVMKIDRSLLLASEGSPRMRAVLQKMVELGHTLGMTVICEGIETTSQERLLLGCGCHYGQGFMYGKPMRRAAFEAFLREHA
ncbi:EAL domain-containing protein [uncultured Selenomonas sp.]|uniref:EAL domain-containing protein n=1 Tax=uncultured Selenomonas sp. TaxID=159275 RepID=UPI0025D576F5|nr:EAL domain-containing protein [uncultured Selenomonas sp.]